MTRFIVQRLIQALVVVIAVSILLFIVLHSLPGGVAAMLGKDATPEQIDLLRRQLGLDQPLFVQYFIWVGGLLHGDMGFSIVRNQPVTTLIAQTLPKTVLLAGLALVVAVVIAVAIGLLQAWRRNRVVDHVFTGIFLTLYATPVFFLAVVLISLFAIRFRIFPPQAPQGETVGDLLADPAGLVLPVFTLALASIALYSRYVRSAGIQQLAEEYVRTARSKGSGEARVVLGHVLRNTLLPVITLLGLSLPFLFSGALVVESTFNYPGVGLLFWQSAVSHDYPVLLGLTLVVSTATVVGSLVADLLYAVVDPRVRYK